MELISKKELLETTNISYGQLYRWKREGIIPEDWFIKKSSYTGQETFFPRQDILERIHSILKMKDSHSLEELSKILSPQENARVRFRELIEITEIDQHLIEILEDELKPADTIDISQIAFLVALSALEVDMEKKLKSVKSGFTALSGIKGGDLCCIFFEGAVGIHIAFIKGKADMVFDSSITVIKSVFLDGISGNIQSTYNHLFI